MNAFEHVPPLPHPFRWIRNHSRRRYEIWKAEEFVRKEASPVATITDEAIARSKAGIEASLERFVAGLLQEGVFK